MAGFILVGVDTDVPIDGSNAPAGGTDAWDIYDHQTSTVVDHGPTLGVAGTNGWKVTYDSSNGQFTIHPPTGASASGANDRYEYRTNGAV